MASGRKASLLPPPCFIVSKTGKAGCFNQGKAEERKTIIVALHPQCLVRENREVQDGEETGDIMHCADQDAPDYAGDGERLEPHPF